MQKTEDGNLFYVCTNEEEVMNKLRKNPSAYRKYVSLNEEWRKKFLDFCTGKKTMPVLYEPFFKLIFHPDVHPDRLSRLISCLLGENIAVQSVLPLEDVLIEGGRQVVMDILVQLADGALATVEVQKIPYLFPGERISCYSSDLVLRQYSRVKGEKGKQFTYKDLKKVYTIVIYEKTAGIFHRAQGKYVHKGKIKFDTGLQLELLQEYCLVALDVFQHISYHEVKDELTGWLSLLVTENPRNAEQLVTEYPWLGEIYRELAAYREKPEEVLNMFSETLQELDRNTMQYMIEQQGKVLEEKEETIKKQEEILREKDAEIVRLQKLLEKDI